jgi:hypothetical protein
MKLKQIVKICIVLCLLAGNALAAENYTLLKPGMGQKWLNEVGVDVTGTLDWLIAGLVVAFIVAFVAFLLIGGIKIFGNSSDMGSPEKKNAGHNAIIQILGGLLLVVFIIRIGLVFFGWF